MTSKAMPKPPTQGIALARRKRLDISPFNMVFSVASGHVPRQIAGEIRNVAGRTGIIPNQKIFSVDSGLTTSPNSSAAVAASPNHWSMSQIVRDERLPLSFDIVVCMRG